MFIVFRLGQHRLQSDYFELRPSSSKSTYFRLSVRPSVCLSVRPSVTPFYNIPVVVSSWNFQKSLQMTEVMSMQKVKVNGQGHRGQNPI